MVDRASRAVGPLVLAFAGLGGTASVIPAVLPAAASRSPAYLQAVPAVFTGLLLGVLLSAVAIRASSTRAVVALGALLQAGALVVLLTRPPVLGFLVAAGGAGLGFGLVEAAGGVLAREAVASVTRLLTVLTGTVALVAATCPLIVAFLPVPDAPSVALALVAGLHLSTVASLGPLARHARAPSGAGRTPVRGREPSASSPAPRALDSALDWTAFPFRELGAVAMVLALYVGVESVFSGWSAVIAADQVATADDQRSAVGTSVFWTLMAVGRFAAWRLLRTRTASVRHPMIALTGAAVMLLVAATTSGPAVAVALCGAIVLLGPCYALILGIGVSRVTAAGAARVTGPLVACGAAGGAGIPWLLLAVTDGPTGRALSLLGAGLLLLAGLLMLPGRRADPSGGCVP